MRTQDTKDTLVLAAGLHDGMAYPVLETHHALQRYVSHHAVDFLDLGSSKGGSLQRLAKRMNVSVSAVLGLDVDDSKLRICNKGTQGRAACAKADLRDLFATSKDALPLVSGTHMLDVLEHINQPRSPTALSIPGYRQRVLDGMEFDTADHAAAVGLWQAACRAARDFCFMEGPAYDNERALRARGFMMYSHAWSGHTCHINSTSIAVAMASQERPGTRLVLLSEPILSSQAPEILRVPRGNPDLQRCNASATERFELGCDRHPPHGRYKSLEASLPLLRYPKNNTHPTDLIHLGVYNRMNALSTFGSTMSRGAALMLQSLATCKGATVVHCDLTAGHLYQKPRQKQACFQTILAEAQTVLSSAEGEAKRPGKSRDQNQASG